MKYSVFFILLFSVACQKQKSDILEFKALEQALSQFEEWRFSNPESVDTLLQHILPEIKSANNNALWAEYYFLKAHVAMAKNDFISVTYLIDSAINRGLYSDVSYKDKVTLLNALNNEQLLLYEDALDYYNTLCVGTSECTLSPNEVLIVYLAKARIAKYLKMPFNKYITKAEDIIQKHSGMNLGLYYSNKAFLSTDPTERIRYSKKSLSYFLNNKMPIKAFSVYSNIASNYIEINLDSALLYIKKAQEYNSDTCLTQLVHNTKRQSYYYSSYANILYYKGEYPEAQKYIELAIPISDSLHLEYLLYGLKKTKSDIYFHQRRYQEARDLSEIAYNHYYAYKLRISENQITYLEAKNSIEEVIKENKILHLNQDNTKLTNRLYLIYSCLISMTLILIIFKWHKMKYHLLIAYERMHKKDLSISELENKVAIINHHIKTGNYPEKTILSKINTEVTSNTNISGWDTFYLMYIHKYPDYDKRIKNKFPFLKPKEMQYIMCTHYGLSDEKMAHIFNLKLASIRKKRQRLRETLELSADEDLKDFIARTLTKHPYKL